jgi:DNA modification methylase
MDDRMMDLEQAPSARIEGAQPAAAPDIATSHPIGLAASLLENLLSEFREATRSNFVLPPDMQSQATRVLTQLDAALLLPKKLRLDGLFWHINRKLRLHRDAVAVTYSRAAARGFTFNHNEKRLIEEAFDKSDATIFREVVSAKRMPAQITEEILATFAPLSRGETLRRFEKECRETTNPRLKRVDATMTQTMLEAIFAGYLFSCFPVRALHDAFDPLPVDTAYEEDFWRRLHMHSSHLFDRNNALWVVSLGQADLERAGSYEDLRERACAVVRRAHAKLNNHCFLAVHIEPILDAGRHASWELAADLTLFAEKFVEERLTGNYFQKDHIRQATSGYIPGLDAETACFDVANLGFSYQDCFVLYPDADDGGAPPSLLLLFQKHQRDETPIPCPACRSHEVRGNSYPKVGVRSWECQNYVCSDRSKSNRGKRYDFLSLLKQHALEDPHNEIPTAFVKSWLRDVRRGTTWSDVMELLVRHYSLAGDVVRIFNRAAPDVLAGRTVISLPGLPVDGKRPFAEFEASPFFRRFLLAATPKLAAPPAVEDLGDPAFRVLNGDALNALRQLESNSIDGAVTSPPYYNARDYAQWPNIYCYLYDIYNVAREMFRVLAPGSLYLYNVFDYFDNENIISLSAMGEKRVTLSAYTVYVFRKCGFELWGNVVWDKGDIEGKRGFNGGNFSPYYQSPFNCWEHVLVFAKPGPGIRAAFQRLPTCLRQKPVFKIVNGENRHGHTAPFPDAVPLMLVELLAKGQIILDPYAGSLTTGRVAEDRGVRSVCIERDRSYCELGLAMRSAATAQRSLFD